MALGEAALGRFPIDQIFLIITFGLFVTVSFPFDIFKLFSNDLPRTPLTSVYQNIGSYVEGNFTPFTNVQYLGKDFPNGLVQVFLLSLSFGIGVFFLYKLFNGVNHILTRLCGWITYHVPKKCRNKIREFYCIVKKKLGISSSVKEGGIVDSSPLFDEKLDFVNWIRESENQKLVDFLYSMQLVATGLLWGAETFFGIVFVSFVIASVAALEIIWSQLEWVVVSLLLCLLLFVVYKVYMLRFNTLFEALRNAFAKSYPLKQLIKLKSLSDEKVLDENEYNERRKTILEKLKRAEGEA